MHIEAVIRSDPSIQGSGSLTKLPKKPPDVPSIKNAAETRTV